MKDKRSTHHPALPLTFHPQEVKEYAKQHWNITFARQKKVSVYAKRIMANVMAMIRENDDELRPYYQMHVTDIVQPSQDQSSVYKEIKKAFDELTDLKWLIEDLEKQKFQYRHLLNTSDINCGYENGVITVVLNPILKPYFIEISHYTTYELKHYMTFSSWYSMRIFEILSAYKDTGRIIRSIGELRELLDCENKYPKTADFLKYTLTEPYEELSKTNLAFEYIPIYDKNHHGRGRKPIVSIEFKLKNVPIKKIPRAWHEHSKEHKRALNRLLYWGVSEKNIITYAPSIGLEKIHKLLYEWDTRRTEIKNKTAYCNKVFVAEGKKNIEIYLI